jgi:hypothetical protein
MHNIAIKHVACRAVHWHIYSMQRIVPGIVLMLLTFLYGTQKTCGRKLDSLALFVLAPSLKHSAQGDDEQLNGFHVVAASMAYSPCMFL